MEVERPRYLKQLIDKKDNGRVKIITGVRIWGQSEIGRASCRERV